MGLGVGWRVGMAAYVTRATVKALMTKAHRGSSLMAWRVNLGPLKNPKWLSRITSQGWRKTTHESTNRSHFRHQHLQHDCGSEGHVRRDGVNSRMV